MYNEDGICSACTAFESRKNIDWDRRAQEFANLVLDIRQQKHQYDCIVPVSGGKDSTYQVVKALEYGLNPLAVTATTDDLSGIGRVNLDNISRLGVDHIEVTTNAKLRRKINAYTLREIGDISWAEHVTIFTIPVRIAITFNVPLIIWGENPQSEYGGPYEAQEARKLDQRWLQEYGGLNGLRVSDLIEQGIGTGRELKLYTYPDIQQKTTSGIFLGQFFPWDGLENAIVASKNGFKTYYGPVEGIGYDYENLDNHQTGIHDRFKYLKYGFGRCTDLVCNHIRRNRLTRREAIEMALLYDGKYPSTYLGKSLEEILEPLEITIPEYIEIENKFANKDLFDIAKGKAPRPLFKQELKYG
jgi:N-acetyl sugar amidotransferase